MLTNRTPHFVTVQIECAGMEPRLDATTGRLSLTLPCYHGPLLTEQALDGMTKHEAALLEDAVRETYLRAKIGSILAREVILEE